MFPEIEKPAQIGRVNKVNPKGVSLRTQLNTDPEIVFKGYESNGTIIDAVFSSYVLGPASISIHAKLDNIIRHLLILFGGWYKILRWR